MRLFALTTLALAPICQLLANPEIDKLSILELADVPAIASSKPESLVFDSASASYVFDASDIADLPVDSIPEMLRYAPGVHIVHPSNGIWGIGMRGINSRFFNRVQFTVDEQNVYNTIFAGIFGNQHDLLLDDVSSVEIAYGPGGGTWNNNAVNGRVNVLMKTAFETEGTILKTKVGTESASAAARVGWAIDETSSARVFAKVGQRASSDTRDKFSNQWDTARAGFRYDKSPSSRDLISISTEAFYSDLGYAYDLANLDTGSLTTESKAESLKGVNAQAKWTRNNPDGSAYSVRGWTAYSDLNAAYAAFDIVTMGIEGRGRFPINDSHELSYNIGAAFDEETTDSTATSDFNAESFNDFAAYAGFQHDWSLIEDTLDLSWGGTARAEDRSSKEIFSPNARLSFKLTENSRIWTSYSLSSRTTPTALNVIESLRSGKIIDDPITFPIVQDADPTNPDHFRTINHRLYDAQSIKELDPETLDAFELGFKHHFSENKGSFQINSFYYKYDNIFARAGTGVGTEHGTEESYIKINITYDNLLKGEAYGYEASFNWVFSELFDVTLGYSRLIDTFEPLYQATVNPADYSSPIQLAQAEGFANFLNDLTEFSRSEFDNSSPGHLATLNIKNNLSNSVSIDTGLRYSSSYDFAKGGQPTIFQLDTRISWQVRDSLRLSLVGRNLLDAHTEDIRLKDFFGHWTETSREVYLEAKLDF